MRVFLDSDVVIAALLSSKGASYAIIHSAGITGCISNISLNELSIVVNRLEIDLNHYAQLCLKLNTIEITTDKHELMKTYSQYVYDENNTHIVEGAHMAKADFLLSFNIKHYNADLIKNELNLQIMTPGKFLQYLRFLGMF